MRELVERLHGDVFARHVLGEALGGGRIHDLSQAGWKESALATDRVFRMLAAATKLL